MKILRAIGHFFAKIGRWIANTAWVQPLLIVGGIFAIIFSIPYIKKGFENLFADDTNEEYEWYEARALTLTEGGQADRLFEYLEYYDEDNAAKIRKEFGSKFIISFVKEGCTNCEDSVEGYKTAASSGYVPGFRLYSILVDYTNDDGDYMAKPIYGKHTGLFEDLGGDFGECDDSDFPLYRNLNTLGKESQVTTLKQKIADELPYAETSSEGISTPLIMMVDLDSAGTTYAGSHGITHCFYNYIDFDYSDTTNGATKAMVIRDFWNYTGIFATDFEE